jgi:diguanylate cyclase (GGDEF)-like protein
MTRQSERAAICRTSEDLAGLLRQLRQQTRPADMLNTGLVAVMNGLGADGAAVIRAATGSIFGAPQVVHGSGLIGVPETTAVELLRQAEVGTPAQSREPDGRPIAVAVCRDSVGERLGLVAWRRRGARAWSDADLPLLDSIACVMRLLFDRDTSEHALARSMRTDPLTALLNQRTFIAEATRHIVRLDRDNLPGTLMLAEVDNLERVRLLLGADGGEQVLRRAAVLLQGTVRPSDLVGRIGDAEFAVWLGGADHLTAAERAEDLCLEAPGKIVGPCHATVPEVSFSIGIATRRVGESFADLARRAGQAVREVKVAGGGYWRVSLTPTS